jgi:hypothetical protein
MSLLYQFLKDTTYAHVSFFLFRHSCSLFYASKQKVQWNECQQKEKMKCDDLYQFPVDKTSGHLSFSASSPTHRPLIPGGRRRQQRKSALQLLIDFEHRPLILELLAVVWRGKNGQNAAIGRKRKFVSLLDHLVRAADEVEVIAGQKLARGVRPKSVGPPAIRNRKSAVVPQGICPNQIVKHAVFGNVNWADQTAQFLDVFE